MGPLAFILVGGLLYFQVDGKLANMRFPAKLLIYLQTLLPEQALFFFFFKLKVVLLDSRLKNGKATD